MKVKSCDNYTPMAEFDYNSSSMVSLTPEQLAFVGELTEASVMADYVTSAPQELVDWFGVHTEQVGKATLLMAPGLADYYYNRVIGLGVGEETSEAQVDEIIERYYRSGVDQFYIHLAPGAKPDWLWEIFESRNLIANGSWVKLIRDTSTPPFIQTELHVDVIGPEYADAFAEIGVEVFGLPEILFPMLANTVGRPGWKHFMAFDGDYPAAAAAMYFHGDTAYLGFMGTRESHQRMGAQSALVTRRIFEAQQAGCKWVVSDTFEHNEDQPNRSLLNLQRLGFEIAYWRVNFVNQL